MNVILDGKPILLMLVLVILPVNIWAVSQIFSAHVDKTKINAGGSLTLILDYEGQTNSEPDLSPLQKDFSILSRQTSEESSFVNGSHRAKTSWILEILPKTSAKDLVIPSIRLGRESTEAISISQSGQMPAKYADDIVLSVTADRDRVYVNGELIVNIVIKTPLSLRNGTLSKLDIKDAIIEPLVDGERSEMVEQGIKYHLFKQTFAIFPSKPGTLIIPPVVFRGLTVAERQAGRGLGGFLGGTKVSSQSKPISITVKDIPSEFPPGHQFLPLKSFVVIEAFDEPNPQLKVNMATPRRFEMKAKGTLATFLPTIAIPSVHNLQVYAEAGSKVQKTGSDSIEASIKFAHIYMPTAPGQLVVPEQTIYWWDTDENKLKTTVIRALQLEVTGEVVTPTQIPPQVSEPQVEQLQKPLTVAKTTEGTDAWKILAAVLFILWLITLSGFLWSRKLKTKNNHSDQSLLPKEELVKRIQAILKACDAQDAKHAYVRAQALCSWADQANVDAVSIMELRVLLKELERALYERDTSLTAVDILPNIKKCVAKIRMASSNAIGLAPLYPN